MAGTYVAIYWRHDEIYTSRKEESNHREIEIDGVMTHQGRPGLLEAMEELLESGEGGDVEV